MIVIGVFAKVTCRDTTTVVAMVMVLGMKVYPGLKSCDRKRFPRFDWWSKNHGPKTGPRKLHKGGPPPLGGGGWGEVTVCFLSGATNVSLREPIE